MWRIQEEPLSDNLGSKATRRRKIKRHIPYVCLFLRIGILIRRLRLFCENSSFSVFVSTFFLRHLSTMCVDIIWIIILPQHSPCSSSGVAVRYLSALSPCHSKFEWTLNLQPGTEARSTSPDQIDGEQDLGL